MHKYTFSSYHIKQTYIMYTFLAFFLKSHSNNLKSIIKKCIYILDGSKNGSCSTTGFYVAISILSILLAIVVVVVFLQKLTNNKTIKRWRRSKSQTYSHDDTQNYSNYDVCDEMHQYSTMDSTKQEYYQNTIKPNQ